MGVEFSNFSFQPSNIAFKFGILLLQSSDYVIKFLNVPLFTINVSGKLFISLLKTQKLLFKHKMSDKTFKKLNTINIHKIWKFLLNNIET